MPRSDERRARLRGHCWVPVLSVSLVALWATTGCKGANAGAPPSAGPVSASTPAPGSVPRPTFDGQRALDLIVKQCDFGPRPVGSEAHQKTRDYLVAEMRKYADKTTTQDFTYKGMPLTNVIGQFNVDAPRTVLLCAHWDTRPTADMEIDPAKKRKPIPGADDGGSGVAVLLELARMFKEQKPEVGVLLVLLDGEDYGDFEKDEGVFLGSRYFAKHHEGYRPAYGILLDMIGNKRVRIYREANSQQYAPQVNDKVFAAARRLGYYSQFVNSVHLNISDDHIPLNQAGIPTIDLIDFDYAPWHTLSDTPDKCSADSLAAVGNTLADVVYGEPARR